jgi:hypothetical protein
MKPLREYQIKAIDAVKKELDKCLILCANCHREEHEKLRNIPQ